jgi:diguanylate cyclase (GGDEF)-like protein
MATIEGAPLLVAPAPGLLRRTRDRRPPAQLESHAWKVFGVAIVQGLVAILVLRPSGSRAWLVATLAALTAGGIVAAVRLHLPHGRTAWKTWTGEPWFIVAAGVLLSGIGNLAKDLMPSTGTAGLGLGGCLWLAGTLLLAIGVLALMKERARGSDLYALFEAAISATLLATVAWVMLIDPLVGSGRVSLVAGLMALMVPTVDLFLVALAAKLARLSDPHGRSFHLVCAGTGLMLLVDFFASLEWLEVLHTPTAFSDLRLLAYALIAVGALHPSMGWPYEPRTAVPTWARQRYLASLAGATFLGPCLLVVRATGAFEVQGSAIALTTAALSVFVVIYLVHLVADRAKVEQLALHDDLTGLPNRVLYGNRLSQACAEADRTGGMVAAMFLDLDRFKTINDSLGHAAGNELLQAVARRLRGCIRAEDTVARLAGDEFALLMTNLADPNDAVAVAEKIVEAFAEAFMVARRPLFVSASVGVALYPTDADAPEALLKNADAAMYKSKEQGRNTYRVYTAAMNVKAQNRLTLENSLHTAIENGELHLHYQPRVDLHSGAVVGMEALARWNHPELGPVSPGEFIPIAEETGLIIPLGEWVLHEACRQTQEWNEAGYAALTVAVNLSARQFELQNIPDVVAQVLRTTGLPAAQLELELTESLAVEEPHAIRATLMELKEIGVQCSIDDFGTGYSGLAYLTRFPLDRLKIDKSFVEDIAEGSDGARLVAAVIGLAHGLRMQVTAEGVETDEQLRFLLDNGCDEMQGYLFSQPIPPEEFERLIRIGGVIHKNGLVALSRAKAGPEAPVAGPVEDDVIEEIEEIEDFDHALEAVA